MKEEQQEQGNLLYYKFILSLYSGKIQLLDIHVKLGHVSVSWACVETSQAVPFKASRSRFPGAPDRMVPVTPLSKRANRPSKVTSSEAGRLESCWVSTQKYGKTPQNRGTPKWMVSKIGNIFKKIGVSKNRGF